MAKITFYKISGLFRRFPDFSGDTVQTKINLNEIARKRHAIGLQIACERLAED